MAASSPCFPREITPPAFGVRAFQLSNEEYLNAGALMDKMMGETDILLTGCFIGRLEKGPCRDTDLESVNIMKETLRRDEVDPDSGRPFFDPTLLERSSVWPERNILRLVAASNKKCDQPSVQRLRHRFRKEILRHDFFDGTQAHLEFVYEASGVNGVLDAFFEMARDRQRKLLYGVNIKLQKELKTTKDLTMAAMKSFMCHLPGEPCPGITHPSAFIGQEATSFNPHIEDCGFQAVNRHIAGAPKLWFVVPPRFFNAFSLLLPQLGVKSSDKFCTDFLNHNEIFIDPRTIIQCGIPVVTVVQKPGDIIYLLPHAIHWGINLGANFNETMNLASSSWAASGMIASARCDCLGDNQEAFDVIPILQAIGVDQASIEDFKNSRTADLMSPLNPIHPSSGLRHSTTIRMEHLLGPEYADQEIGKLLAVTRATQQIEEPAEVWGGYDDIILIDSGSEEEEEEEPAAAPGSNILACPKPGCNKTYQGGIVKRLREHVQKKHSQDEAFPAYQQTLDERYPPRNKSARMQCTRCGSDVAGTAFNMTQHMKSSRCVRRL